MIIHHPRRYERNGRVGIAATIEWETASQPQRDIFIETDAGFGKNVCLNADAFVVGCIVPAMHLGESRIAVQADMCPFLREGLDLVMALMEQWSQGRSKPLRIEAGLRRFAIGGSKARRAALFLSGGFDSLAALRANRGVVPESHPAAIKDCFFVHGFDIGGVIERGMKMHVYDRALKALDPIAQDAGVTLIPVYTNIRHLCDQRDLWLNQFFGAVLAAVAHVFARRNQLVYIGSSYDLAHIHPCGSHPLLDPAYSSYDVRIQHRDLALTRVDKLRIVAGWEVAFQHFRVCLANVQDRLNCGACEKCIRTMLGLEAIGALDKTAAFLEDTVLPEQLLKFNIRIRVREPFYEEVLPLLKARGRHDLVATIQHMLRQPPGA